jgi:hypothetical protein
LVALLLLPLLLFYRHAKLLQRLQEFVLMLHHLTEFTQAVQVQEPPYKLGRTGSGWRVYHRQQPAVATTMANTTSSHHFQQTRPYCLNVCTTAVAAGVGTRWLWW